MRAFEEIALGKFQFGNNRRRFGKSDDGRNGKLQSSHALFNEQLFSVGVVAYEAVFGEHPFVTGNEIDYNQIWYQTITVNPKTYIIDGDTDGFLVAFIKTLMQKQLSKRPPSAAKALEWFYTTKKSLNI